MTRTLHLTLMWEPFEVMFTGEKTEDYRSLSKWNGSRLANPYYVDRFKPRNYDTVKFTNGYGPKRPWFEAQYLGAHLHTEDEVYKYSNGLMVAVPEGFFVIRLGKVIAWGNVPVELQRKVNWHRGIKNTHVIPNTEAVIESIKRRDEEENKKTLAKMMRRGFGTSSGEPK